MLSREFELVDILRVKNSNGKLYTYESKTLKMKSRMALRRDDIRQAKITTKPRFENGNFKFYHELISKAAKLKRIPT